ncbi:MAG: cyclic nucleotide-binding domain-containing protein [Deltaproteobacteria bacterium]|nr:cyclic nucleotide-binding domain-containing protein [Deltaproteobacteria bacterium]
MADALALLKAHKIFTGLQEASVAAIAGISVVQRPAPGTAIFSAGAPNTAIYFITAGNVRIQTAAKVDLGALGPNEVLGGLSVLSPAKHAADATAGEGCEIVVVPLAKLQQLSKTSANLTSQLVFRLMRAFAVSSRALGLEQLFH